MTCKKKSELKMVWGEGNTDTTAPLVLWCSFTAMS